MADNGIREACTERPLMLGVQKPQILLRSANGGLRPSANQVAGHRFQEGSRGSLVDSGGIFYKPVPDGPKKARGDCEIAFYQQLESDARVPSNIRRFFPKYAGVFTVQNVDGGDACRHLGMEDLASGYCNPSIMDIKVGRRTWHFGESQSQIQKCIDRDAGTTQVSLGFRISGMQVFHPLEGTTWQPERHQGKLINDETMGRVLKGFVSTNHGWWNVADSNCPEPNGALVEEVYGGPNGLIAQLREMEAWFGTQTQYHFYSSSVLFMYDGRREKKSVEEESAAEVDAKDEQGGEGSHKHWNRRVNLRIIDFAHVVNGGGTLDLNFLHGLQSLTALLTSLLEAS